MPARRFAAASARFRTVPRAAAAARRSSRLAFASRSLSVVESVRIEPQSHPRRDSAHGSVLRPRLEPGRPARPSRSEALRELERAGARDVAASPAVESPALLPAGAPARWNRPYLNLVARTRIPRAVDPDDWRRTIKSIESRLGRDLSASRWSPRPVDIDILLWDRRTIRTEHLTIPHPEILERSFVLTPLAHLAPRMTIPGCGDATVLDWSGRVRPIPLWMGIVNCTPDSFSGDRRIRPRTPRRHRGPPHRGRRALARPRGGVDPARAPARCRRKRNGPGSKARFARCWPASAACGSVPG